MFLFESIVRFHECRLLKLNCVHEITKKLLQSHGKQTERTSLFEMFPASQVKNDVKLGELTTVQWWI